MTNKLSKLFGNSNIGYNALYTALHNAAYATYEETDKLYAYVERTPRTSLVCELVEQLDMLGFEITKKDQ